MAREWWWRMNGNDMGGTVYELDHCRKQTPNWRECEYQYGTWNNDAGRLVNICNRNESYFTKNNITKIEKETQHNKSSQ